MKLSGIGLKVKEIWDLSDRVNRLSTELEHISESIDELIEGVGNDARRSDERAEDNYSEFDSRISDVEQEAKDHNERTEELERLVGEVNSDDLRDSLCKSIAKLTERVEEIEQVLSSQLAIYRRSRE